jgi:hypothetical protein
MKLVQQTEDVLVDTRGNIYITDRQWGLYVPHHTGQGEPPPTAKVQLPLRCHSECSEESLFDSARLSKSRESR